MGRFVKPVAIVASPDLSKVDYTAATSQLDDDDMDVGTACRQFIRDAQTATDEGGVHGEGGCLGRQRGDREGVLWVCALLVTIVIAILMFTTCIVKCAWCWFSVCE